MSIPLPAAKSSLLLDLMKKRIVSTLQISLAALTSHSQMPPTNALLQVSTNSDVSMSEDKESGAVGLEENVYKYMNK